MKGLNPQQIVLLCLLVAFVSSIVSAVSVVSIMDQSSAPITQTINRVVERTIEKVVEQGPEGQQTERIVETVVVNQEDLTVEAVSKNSDSVARVYSEIDGVRTFRSIGIIVSGDGRIVVDSSSLTPGVNYIGVYKDGEFAMNIVKDENGLALLEPQDTGGKTFSPASINNSQIVKLGQTVILISGRNSNAVSTGIITNLNTATGEVQVDENGNEIPSTESIVSIEASVDSSRILPGSIIVNLQGGVIGFKVSSATLPLGTFYSSSVISSFASSVQ